MDQVTRVNQNISCLHKLDVPRLRSATRAFLRRKEMVFLSRSVAVTRSSSGRNHNIVPGLGSATGQLQSIQHSTAAGPRHPLATANLGTKQPASEVPRPPPSYNVIRNQNSLDYKRRKQVVTIYLCIINMCRCYKSIN